jgi:hypothetical protein
MADKTVTIKGASDKQLDELLIRLRKENEVQNIISDIKRKSSSGYMPHDYAQEVSTEKPIDSLYHFGIPGMHWGIHKKTIPVTTTVHGKRVQKMTVVQGKPTPKTRTKTQITVTKDEPNYSDDHKKKTSLKKKKVSEMSNKELKELNERMQLERQYKELSRQDISAGRKFAQDLLRDVGKELAKEALKKILKDPQKTIGGLRGAMSGEVKYS